MHRGHLLQGVEREWRAAGAGAAEEEARESSGSALLRQGLRRVCWEAMFRIPLMPPDLKKNCVPYCSLSFSVHLGDHRVDAHLQRQDVDLAQHRIDGAVLAGRCHRPAARCSADRG